MNGSDFLNFAATLAGVPSYGPAGFRSSVSCAYYGAFHIVRDFLNDHQIFCRNRDNEHKWAQYLLLNCGVQAGKEIGQLLSNLQESRVQADYKFRIAQVESKANALLCVQRAKSLETKINQVKSSANLGQLIDGIKEYRQRSGK